MLVWIFISINPEQMPDLAEVEQNFGRIMQIADKLGCAYICVNDRPRYIFIDVESSYNLVAHTKSVR